MPTTLLTYDQARAGLPDNTANLISPADARNAILSVAADAGEISDDTAFTLPLAVGVPTNLNNASPAPTADILARWSVDGNSALIPDWGATITPAGLERAVSASAIIDAEIDSVSDQDIQIDLLRGATIVATVTVTMEGGAGTSDILHAILALESYEVDAGEPWSIQVTNLTASNNLDVDYWALRLIGVIL